MKKIIGIEIFEDITLHYEDGTREQNLKTQAVADQLNAIEGSQRIEIKVDDKEIRFTQVLDLLELCSDAIIEELVSEGFAINFIEDLEGEEVEEVDGVDG